MAASSRFMACCLSLRMDTASSIHLVNRSGSLSITVAWYQLILWFCCMVGERRFVVFCKLDVRWLMWKPVLFLTPLLSCVPVTWHQTSFQFHPGGLITVGTTRSLTSAEEWHYFSHGTFLALGRSTPKRETPAVFATVYKQNFSQIRVRTRCVSHIHISSKVNHHRQFHQFNTPSRQQ